MSSLAIQQMGGASNAYAVPQNNGMPVGNSSADTEKTMLSARMASESNQKTGLWDRIKSGYNNLPKWLQGLLTVGGLGAGTFLGYKGLSRLVGTRKVKKPGPIKSMLWSNRGTAWKVGTVALGAPLAIGLAGSALGLYDSYFDGVTGLFF